MKTLQYDLVVVGGGGSGLIAAVRAKQLSGKRVLVIEKNGKTGGGMQMARTMRVFHSKWQEEHGIEDKTAEFMRSVMDLSLWRVDLDLARACIEGTGKYFDWFCEIAPEEVKNFKVGGYIFDMPNGQKAPDFEGTMGGACSGNLMMRVMREKCEEYGVDVLTRTTMTDVEMKDGVISAVIAQNREGEQFHIECSRVVLASGSWISNPKLVDKIMPKFAAAEKKASPHMSPMYTGDAFQVVEKLGGYIDYDSCCIRLMGPHYHTRSMVASQAAGSDFAIGVNLLGRRFTSEPMVPRMDFFDTGHVLVDQPKATTFWVFDKKTLEAAMAKAKDPAEAPPRPLMPPHYPDTIEESLAEVEAAVDGKELFRGDTPAELAEAMGVDVERFVKTIADYNMFCANGMDWEGYKDQKKLVPMEGPFYAVRGWLDNDGAFGGVDVNYKMQVLKEDKSVLPNVYAAGDLTGSRFIVTAGVKRQILNDMSWAFSSGFIAGTQAADGL